MPVRLHPADADLGHIISVLHPHGVLHLLGPQRKAPECARDELTLFDDGGGRALQHSRGARADRQPPVDGGVDAHQGGCADDAAEEAGVVADDGVLDDI